MNSRIIENRENEERSLKIQYAARVYYNSAECFSHLAWITSMLSAITIFLSNNWCEYLVKGIPSLLTVLTAIFTIATRNNVKWAAKLRQYFDLYVMGLSMKGFSESDCREVIEKAEKKYQVSQSKARVQMDNTGKDVPPGVRDWYVFPREYDGNKAQLECQRQNIWWNSHLFKKKITINVITLVLIIALFVYLIKSRNIVVTLLCLISLFLKIISRCYANIKYYITSKEIDGALKIVEAEPTNGGIEKLQDLIHQRRATNVLGFNFLHRKNAKRLSSTYENTSPQA